MDTWPKKSVIVSIWLLHVPQLKTLLQDLILEKYPTRKLIVVNTVSESYLTKSMPLLTRRPLLEELIETEKPYTLSGRAEAAAGAAAGAASGAASEAASGAEVEQTKELKYAEVKKQLEAFKKLYPTELENKWESFDE